MSIAQNYPAISPSLNLSFALTKELDPRITFTRASTATYYGTQTAKAEENLLLQSQTFDNASWSLSNATVTANSTAAPDGTTTAEKLQETAATGSHVVTQGVTFLAVPYTASVFVKAAERGFALFSCSTIDAISVNLTTGVATSVLGLPTNITSTDAGNGWYRVSFTFTPLASSLTINIYASTDGVWANRAYAGTAGSGIFIWGAQLEQRSAVTAYTVTTTQPITNYIPQLLTAASGVARFDHNPTTFESLGLEIEEQRTNLLTYSEQFDNAAWIKSNSSVSANATVSPDGTTNADRLIPSVAATDGRISQSFTGSIGATYTLTAYGKADTFSNFRLYSDDGALNSASVSYNLATGAITTAVGSTGTWTNASSTITPVGNGWYRASLTWTAAITAPTRVVIWCRDTGDGYSGIFIWGAQLEAGAFPTSYIPTVASQVTRANDLAVMTGTNFSSWYNQGQGTLYADSASSGTASVRYIANYNDGTTSNRIAQYFTATASSGLVTTNGTSQALLSTSAATPVKHALAYAVNDFIACANGELSGADTGGVVPLVNQLIIGSSPGNTSPVNGTIKKIAYYPLRVTNAQLQGLTS